LKLTISREFTDDLNDSDYNSDNSNVQSPLLSQATSKNSGSGGDPLAEFYAQAKSDIEASRQSMNHKCVYPDLKVVGNGRLGV
jgi:hypothetical protein